jgi:hypothetical protein
MAHNEAARYQAAADRCRTRSSSSGDSREWIRFSQEWEKLAELTEALSANRLNRAEHAANGSLAFSSPGSCENPRKSLLFAGVFCSRRAPSFHCDPLSCETSELASRPRAASTVLRRR